MWAVIFIIFGVLSAYKRKLEITRSGLFCIWYRGPTITCSAGLLYLFWVASHDYKKWISTFIKSGDVPADMVMLFIGLLLLFYIASFRVILTDSKVIVRRWPFGSRQVLLNELNLVGAGNDLKIESKGKRIVAIDFWMSGSQCFIEQLRSRLN